MKIYPELSKVMKAGRIRRNVIRHEIEAAPAVIGGMVCAILLLIFAWLTR